jgi:hypothetical protein
VPLVSHLLVLETVEEVEDDSTDVGQVYVERILGRFLSERALQDLAEIGGHRVKVAAVSGRVRGKCEEVAQATPPRCSTRDTSKGHRVRV